MPRPVHFEIHAEQPARAIAFYEALFGWTFTSWGGGVMEYWLVTTGPDGEPGINGGLMQRKNPGQPFMNYIAVKSIEASLKKVEGAGGSICMPKTEIGSGMGWIAAFQDTEGNLMGFHQPPAKPAVKKKPAKKAAKKK